MWKSAVIGFWLIWLAWMDLRKKYVPVWLLAFGGIYVTIMLVIEAWGGKFDGMVLFWSMGPGIVLLGIAILTKKAGWADGVILLFLGIQIGFRACVYSFTLSMLFISIVSLVLLVFKRVRKNTKLPYLPFLCVGYLVQTALGLTA